MEDFVAFAQANWRYAAAAFLLLLAWTIWEIKRAPEYPYNDRM